MSELGPGGEFDLIREILAAAGRRQGAGVAVGPGDDAAVVAGEAFAVTTDLSVEGVHFRTSWLDPREIGYRAVAVALSDLAAMAADPVGILVSLALPGDAGPELVRELARGFREASEGVEAALLGGDLTRSPGPLVLNVTAVGRAPRPILRSGARADDRLWVTGRLGAAAGAVKLWGEGGEPDEALRSAFARPAPRIREALWLAERVELTALIDLSDGLVGDAGHLAAAAGAGIVLDAWAVPVHPALAAVGWDGEEVLRVALSGGEDYELCLVAGPGVVETVTEAFRERFGLELTPVGRVTEGQGVLLRNEPDGRVRPPPWHAFDHFSGDGGS